MSPQPRDIALAQRAGWRRLLGFEVAGNPHQRRSEQHEAGPESAALLREAARFLEAQAEEGDQHGG